ncbi:MAG TPA: AAA family ATPase, partial [Ilumatobacteraceae bacterium]|nr:AAA family ATPase [Ilumatobacteraceae bacterium]
STSGKSWLALQWALEVLQHGAVVYVDYEDSEIAIVNRLLALKANPRHVADRFFYVQPEGSFGPAEKAAMNAVFDRLNPDLIVIDAFVGALTAEGLDENVAQDVDRWQQNVGRWLIQASGGAAILLLDHVKKDPD